MAFVKLDCAILNSTIWVDRIARELFITALLMAEPFDTAEPLPQIAVGSLDLTGWSVPPGWYGFVSAASTGIIHRAGLDAADGPVLEAAMDALTRLGEPEPESRSPEYDGRRLVRVAGGFVVLNFMKYREKDATAADRSRRWRERKKASASRVSETPQRVIRHQAEAEAEAEADKEHTQERVRVTAAQLPTTEIAARAAALLDTYGESYTKHRKGAKHLRLGSNLDWTEACKLCETWDDARLSKLIDIFLTTDDEWVSSTARTFRLFVTRASWCDDRLAQWEAKQRRA